MILWIDGDACPVKDEACAAAVRAGVTVRIVSNGGLRPSAFPSAEMIYVATGPDEADKRIAEGVEPGDIVITSDIPLAARVVAAGGRVVKPDGEVLSDRNIGPVLASRDLASDLRAADPFRQGGGRPFGKSDRARFGDAIGRELRRPAK